jgi:IQ domain-containing protein H
MTDEDLFACIINKQQVWEAIHNPKQKFKGP